MIDLPTEETTDNNVAVKATVLPFILLALVLLLGAYFRFTGLDWDGSNHLHPDERFLTIVTSSLQRPTSVKEYFQTSISPLNPYNKGHSFYVYGNFPMTAVRFAAETVHSWCQTATENRCERTYISYDGIHLVGRAMSGIIDLISIYFLFLIGRRLYNWRVALIGTLLLAVAVMPIQQSHFYTMDNWAAAFCTITVYMAVRAAEDGRRIRWWVGFGLALGLATASRVNVAPIALLAGVAAFSWLSHYHKGWVNWFHSENWIRLQWAITGVAIAALTSMIVFRIAQPYAFADKQIVIEQTLAETGVEPSPLTILTKSIFSFNPQWLANLEEIQRLQKPEAVFPPALQWTNRPDILFPLTNMILYGMGLTAGLFAWTAFLFAGWHLAKGKENWQAHLLPISWILLYFFFIATRWVKSVRYFLPIYPLLLLLAGWLLIYLWDRTNKRVIKTAVIALATLVILPPFLWAQAFVRIYQQPVTRVAASEWVFDHIPSGATLIYETDGIEKEIQLPLKTYHFYPEAPPLRLNFHLPEDGTVTAVRLNYLQDLDIIEGVGDNDEETLILTLNSQPIPVQQTATVNLMGKRESITFDLAPTKIAANNSHTVEISMPAGSGPIYASTSVIISEHWDDPLPVRLPDRDGYHNYYVGAQDGPIPITGFDSEEKRQSFYRWLEEADYIILSSQRALWSLPRMRLTYPVTLQYYESLFNGELGFKQMAQFHADLHIGPLYLSDTGFEYEWGRLPDIGWPAPSEWAAEEAFSVYDHPPVWIFKKTDQYSIAQAATILGQVDLSQQVGMNPGEATNAPNGLMMTDETAALQQANGTYADMFPPTSILNQQPWLAAIVWWLAVVALGLICFPLCFTLFPGLTDRGYGVSRILSLLWISYFAWIMGSYQLLYHTRSTLMIALLLLILLSGFLYVYQKKEIDQFFQEQKQLIGRTELIALFLYVAFILVRLGNPDAWDVIWGGEKPMDFSYFNAVLKSAVFPPYDPWHAGGYINYYYYGFVYVGSITKLLGIAPRIAYNLILPMLFSFVGTAVFSITYNVVSHDPQKEKRPYLAGIFAALLALVLGNLGELGVMLEAWRRTSESQINTGFALIDQTAHYLSGLWNILLGKQIPMGTGDWFWIASRAINSNPGEVQPITEFPYFTFLYGDLHAHMVSMPLTMLALAWAINLVLLPKGFTTPRWQTILRWLIGAVAIGSLKATNTWDLPTYLLFGNLAVIYYTYRQHQEQLSLSFFAEAGYKAAALTALALLSFWPFTANYGVGYASVRLWEGSYTHFSNYIIIYGLFFFLMFTHLAREFRQWSATWTEEGKRSLEPVMKMILITIFAYLFMVVTLAWRGYWIAPFALTVALASGLLSLRPNISTARRLILILIAAALSLTLMVEIIVLDGDVGRMNTVFKFYMQVWLILSIVGGCSIGWHWEPIQMNWSPLGRKSWRMILALLIGIASLYPILATRAKWKIRMSKEAPTSLDGMAFLETTSYEDSGNVVPLNYDLEAIEWMQQNISGSPVIAEAHGKNPYRSVANRVAMYTGLPAIIGWDWHQRQQRTVVPHYMVTTRIRDVDTLYNSGDAEEAMRLLNKYDVQYIYVGQLEWIYYSAAGILKFQRMAEKGLLVERYRNGGASVYEVIR